MQRRSFIKIIIGLLIQGSSLTGAVHAVAGNQSSSHVDLDDHIKDYLNKMRYFYKSSADDLYLPRTELKLLDSTTKRLKRVQSIVGYGNFHLLSFDDAIKYAKNYSRVGRFSKSEISFLDDLFHRDATSYGFIGSKPSSRITDHINRKDVIRMRRSGHYLFKGQALETFKSIENDLGKQVVLTSGIRGISKQFLLFMRKAVKNRGNLSLASRSLAPPGYSFHSTGDFDVGQHDFGGANFTGRFTKSQVYKNLIDYGYANLRYEKNNLLGVRFEPWHIKLT